MFRRLDFFNTETKRSEYSAEYFIQYSEVKLHFRKIYFLENIPFGVGFFYNTHQITLKTNVLFFQVFGSKGTTQYSTSLKLRAGPISESREYARNPEHFATRVIHVIVALYFS